jgi:hypothetical protein
VPGVGLMRAYRGQRSVEHAEGCRDQRLAGKETRIRNQIAGFEIVRPVEHQVVTADQRHRVVSIEPRGVRRKPDVGIERMNLPGGAVDLAPADVRRGVNDLTLEIGQRDDVVIDRAEHADAGRGEIHQRGCAEAARADHQHGCFLQGGLAGAADFAQHDVASVSFEFFGTQHDQVIPSVLSVLMVRSASEFIIGPRFARTRWRVSNHVSTHLILRDAAKRPLLRMRVSIIP